MRKHNARRACKPFHVLQRQLIVPSVALLSPVNHAVYVLTCIVRETDILAFLGQKLRNLLRRPIPNVRLVQLLVVLQDALRTELQHERVFNLARFRQFLTGHHFVRFDVLRGTPMRHLMYTGKNPSLRSF